MRRLVYVKKVKGKRYLQLSWVDPESGKERRRSCRTSRLRDAMKQADQLERSLQFVACGDPYARAAKTLLDHPPTIVPPLSEHSR